MKPDVETPQEPASVATIREKVSPAAAKGSAPETWPALSEPQQSAEAVACVTPQQCAAPQASDERDTAGASSCAEAFAPKQSGSAEADCSAHTNPPPATTDEKGPAAMKKDAPSVAETAAAATPREACAAAEATAGTMEAFAPKQCRLALMASTEHVKESAAAADRTTSRGGGARPGSAPKHESRRVAPSMRHVWFAPVSTVLAFDACGKPQHMEPVQAPQQVAFSVAVPSEAFPSGRRPQAVVVPMASTVEAALGGPI